MVVAASPMFGKVPGGNGGGAAKGGKGRRPMKGKKKNKMAGEFEKALHKAVQDLQVRALKRNDKSTSKKDDSSFIALKDGQVGEE